MKSYESFRKCIGRFIMQISNALNLSPSMVYKWMEPRKKWSESGQYNPVDRIETTIEAALELGQDFNDAIAPLVYLIETVIPIAARLGIDNNKALTPLIRLNRHFNMVAFPLPASNNGQNIRELQKGLFRIIEEFSSLTRESAQVLKQDAISEEKSQKIIKEGWRVMESIGTFIKIIEQQNSGNNRGI